MGLKGWEGKESPSEGILPETHMESLFSLNMFPGWKKLSYLVSKHRAQNTNFKRNVGNCFNCFFAI